MKEIYKQGDYDLSKNTELLAQQGKMLANTVLDNFQVDFKTPDYAMLERLQKDVWHFTSAKNYQQLKDLSLALVDENGKIRTFSQFKEQAEKIGEKFNKTWLETEYNQAMNASTAAARWSDYEKNKDVMTNLRYETAGDSFVRSEHAILNGIIKPMDDVFWNTYYPPNGWNCRCEAVQIPNNYGTSTPDNRTPSINIPPMFRTNLAKTGMIFPKGHPYYKINDAVAQSLKGFELNTRISNEEKLFTEKYMPKKLVENDGHRTDDWFKDRDSFVEKYKLSRPESIAITEYTNDWAKDFNKKIYNNEVLSEKLIITRNILNRGLDKLPNIKGTVYRGLKAKDLPDNFLEKYQNALKSEKSVSEFAFGSTTIDINVAKYRAESNKENGFLFIDNIKKGKDIDVVSKFKSTEKEVLMKSGTEYKITKIEVENNTTFIYREEL